jgi:hypothetical protein
VRAYGGASQKTTNKWPSPYVLICGALLVVSLFEHFWRPLKWFALAGTAAGLPPIILRSIAAARRLTLDVNILMLIAGTQFRSLPSDDVPCDSHTTHIFHVTGLHSFSVFIEL